MGGKRGGPKVKGFPHQGPSISHPLLSPSSAALSFLPMIVLSCAHACLLWGLPGTTHHAGLQLHATAVTTIQRHSRVPSVVAYPALRYPLDPQFSRVRTVSWNWPTHLSILNTERPSSSDQEVTEAMPMRCDAMRCEARRGETRRGTRAGC